MHQEGKKRKRILPYVNPPCEQLAFLREEDFISYSIFQCTEKRQKAVPAAHTTSQPPQIPTIQRFPDLGRHSSLTLPEHQQFLDFERRHRANALDAAQRILFAKLQIRVAAEQDLYRNTIRSIALANNGKIYLKYHPAIKAHVEQILAKKRARTVQVYPRYWRQHERVEFNTIRVTQGDPVLTHRSTVHEEGRVLFFQFPKLGTELRTDWECYDLSKPALSSSGPALRWQKKGLLPVVSQDTRAARLITDNAVDVVTSSSVLSCLIDVLPPHFSTAWEIPVVISRPAGGQKKVVYLDKPLLPKKMTLREKNELFAKLSFESLCADTSTSTSIRLSPSSLVEPLSLPDDNVTYNLWAFGDLTLLVRCKIHGYLSDSTTSRGTRYVGVTAKMEYLPELGFEEITPSETSRMWIKTFIRPDAHMVLCRVEAQSMRIQQVTQQDMRAILFPGCSFNPLWSSKVLFTLLQRLVLLPEGSYLVSHRAGEGLLTIYSSLPEDRPSPHYQEGILDLHSAHASSGATNKDAIPYIPPQWLPSPDRIPYTFPPVHSKPNRFSKVKYCYSYAETGTCKKGVDCSFPHLDLANVQQIAAETKRKKKKKKAKNSHTPTTTYRNESESPQQEDLPTDLLYIMREHV